MANIKEKVVNIASSKIKDIAKEKIKEKFDNEVEAIKNNGKEVVSYKHIYAAINLIKLKTENRIFAFGSIVSVIFLCTYGYLIYLNVNVYSLRHIIVYSILSALLIVSIVFNIVFHPMKKRNMSTKERIKRKNIIDMEKNIVMLISILTKIVSLGYMLFEIFTIDSSLKRLIPFGTSVLALIFQILITYISRLVICYYDILLVAIDSDIKNSGMVDILAEKNVLKEPIYISTGINSSKVGKIRADINDQLGADKSVKSKNKKDYLFDLTMYCLINQSKKEDVIRAYDLPPSIVDNLLDKISELGILVVKEDTTIEMLISDINIIKEKIYYS